MLYGGTMNNNKKGKTNRILPGVEVPKYQFLVENKKQLKKKKFQHRGLRIEGMGLNK